MAAEVADTDVAVTGKRHWLLVITLMLIYMYAFIDRMILALLVDPVKESLGAGDLQMSLLLGLAFASLYCACNIPAGFFADRMNRRLLLGVASVFWALMTVLCGLSSNFTELFLARAGVGIAEGVIAPTAFSLIRDGVPTRSRALAFSIYGMAPMIGSSFALVGGAYLMNSAEAGAFANMHIFQGLEPWQVTLVIVGACGLPLSLLMLVVSEPARLGGEATIENDSILRSLIIACRYIMDHRKVYVPLLVFAAFGAMMSFAKSAWFPAALGRHWDLTPSQVGPPLGLMTLLGGVFGLLIGGWIMNRSIARGRTAMDYAIVGVIGTAMGLVIAFTAPNIDISFAGIQVSQFFVGVSFAAGATTLGQVTPVSMMGRVSAVYLVVQTLIGQSAGPFIVAFVSKTFFGGPEGVPAALTVSMAGISFVCTLAALAIIRWHGQQANPG